MSAATKTYQPRILTPTMKRPVAGLTVYLVESHTANEFYFCWVQPSGYIRCQCRAAKFGNECCHKKALAAHLAAHPKLQMERLTCSYCSKQVPDRGQLRHPMYVCESCKREAALLDTESRFSFVDGLPLAV